jgi:pSer/pThr/pTyr-binding forkhead associated (FHA) protein
MAPNDSGHTANEGSAETTAALPDEDLLGLDEVAPTGAEDPVESGLERLPSGVALLIVKRGPSAGARFLLDRNVLSVGRHPDSEIFLDDITVSRRHAEVRREGGEFLIADTGSLNGIYINRQPVDTATLANHDEIQIGNFRLVFLTAPTPR